MEAEDTVMSEEEIISRVTEFHFHGSNNRHDLVRDAVKAQAEISFKIGMEFAIKETTLETMETGKQLGRAEVVELIGDRIKHTTSAHKFNETSLCFACRYEAKLKEWGIK